MRKYCLLFVFVIGSSIGAGFDDIVERAKAGELSPKMLMEELRAEEGSVRAKLFLRRFGGKDFKGDRSVRVCELAEEESIENEIGHVAKSLGEAFYKRGADSWKDDGSLKLAQQLLNYSVMQSGRSLIGNRTDVDDTLFNERLEDMQQARRDFAETLNIFAERAEAL